VERTARAPVARAPVRGPKRLLRLRPDTHLVELVRAGDASAFEVLYERHVAGVLGFCRHMLGSQEEAEDAVQQAFVSAHDAMRRNGREIVFKPWLYTIARNRCLSILRARREQPAELPELSTAGLSEEVDQRADLRELVRDVQRLPEQQRAALVLSELGDLSHAEVAEVIGQEPQAVKGLVFRARAALAERRDARGADCDEIRVELAAATGGGLRRGRLRYHLESCPGCTAYLGEVRRQRSLLGLALPVVPTLALKESVLGSAGIGAGTAGAVGAATSGGGAAGAAGATAAGGTGAASAGGAAGVAAAGGAVTAGGTMLGGVAVKLAVVGAVLAGGAGVATEVARERGDDPSVKAPAAVRDVAPAPGASGAGARDTAGPGSSDGGTPSARALERRRGARGQERRALGQARALERSTGRSAAGEAHGKAVGGNSAPVARDNGKPASDGQGDAIGRARAKSAPVASPPRQDADGNGAPTDPGNGAGSGGGGSGGALPQVSPPRSQAPDTSPPPATGGTRPDQVAGGVENRPAPLD
jgi:RNA polymerase sigma factor (sigma-70 family)